MKLGIKNGTVFFFVFLFSKTNRETDCIKHYSTVQRNYKT